MHGTGGTEQLAEVGEVASAPLVHRKLPVPVLPLLLLIDRYDPDEMVAFEPAWPAQAAPDTFHEREVLAVTLQSAGGGSLQDAPGCGAADSVPFEHRKLAAPVWGPTPSTNASTPACPSSCAAGWVATQVRPLTVQVRDVPAGTSQFGGGATAADGAGGANTTASSGIAVGNAKETTPSVGLKSIPPRFIPMRASPFDERNSSDVWPSCVAV
ncbi:MAG: hypothetical protein ABS98_11650 [Lysobacteraceae bacterium SCN 69-48]|nr:MAG: hypothetical protein ABS98_11650 [Xanthomonadaceae bacterium SCN 69-48]